MNITKHFHWCFNFKNHRLFLEYFLAFFCESDDMFSPECEIAVAVELGGPFSGSEEDIQEELV
jgi:hypothetical protein